MTLPPQDASAPSPGSPGEGHKAGQDQQPPQKPVNSLSGLTQTVPLPATPSRVLLGAEQL